MRREGSIIRCQEHRGIIRVASHESLKERNVAVRAPLGRGVLRLRHRVRTVCTLCHALVPAERTRIPSGGQPLHSQ